MADRPTLWPPPSWQYKAIATSRTKDLLPLLQAWQQRRLTPLEPTDSRPQQPPEGTDSPPSNHTETRDRPPFSGQMYPCHDGDIPEHYRGISDFLRPIPAGRDHDRAQPPVQFQFTVQPWPHN